MRREAVNPEWHPELDRLAALRQAFDRSFAEAPTYQVTALQDLLDIRLGATPYALRLVEISGLFADMKITPVPTRVPELLGIAGFRGSLLPVYDLRALVGHRVDGQPRWVAIAEGNSLGLAFDRFEGHMRVGEDAMVPHGGRENAVRHVREVVRIDGLVRPIVSIRSVLESVTSRVRSGAREKE
jgi:chemotaxis signal transduction protein